MSRSPLVDAHIEGEARLRRLLVRAVGTAWTNLPAHDRANVDEWLAQVLPAVATAQRASVALTEAFIAQIRERAPLGLAQDELIGAAVRNGAAPAVVYERPFVTYWSSLANGLSYEEALAKGGERATSAAAMDVQLSMRATADAVGKADHGIYGFARRADATACDFCTTVDGAYVKHADAMPLHNHCGCGLEPLTDPHPGAVFLPDGTQVRFAAYGPLYDDKVAVHEHGELGPVLTAPGDHFTGPSEI